MEVLDNAQQVESPPVEAVIGKIAQSWVGRWMFPLATRLLHWCAVLYAAIWLRGFKGFWNRFKVGVWAGSHVVKLVSYVGEFRVMKFLYKCLRMWNFFGPMSWQDGFIDSIRNNWLLGKPMQVADALGIFAYNAAQWLGMEESTLSNITENILPALAVIIPVSLLTPALFSYGPKVWNRLFRKPLKSDDERAICIIGGGFAGISAAVQLEKLIAKRGRNDFGHYCAKVYLVDGKNHFTNQSLLYELATHNAVDTEVNQSYADIIGNSEILSFIQAKVHGIDLRRNTLIIQPSLAEKEKDKGGQASSANDKFDSVFHEETKDEIQMPFGQAPDDTELIGFDQLILATGLKPAVKSIEGADEFALPFHSDEDARMLSNRLDYLEKTHDREASIGPKVVIIGGGFCGVELATNIADRLRTCKVAVTIVTDTGIILKEAPLHQRRRAEKRLRELRVTMRYNTSAEKCTANGVHLISGSGLEFFLESDLTLFAGGCEQTDLVQTLNISKESDTGRIAVRRTLQSVDHENVFAIGDCAGIDGIYTSCNVNWAKRQAHVAATNVMKQWDCYLDINENLDEDDHEIIAKHKLEHVPSKPTSFWTLSLGIRSASVSFLNGWIPLSSFQGMLVRRTIHDFRMPTLKQRILSSLQGSVAITKNLIFGQAHA